MKRFLFTLVVIAILLGSAVLLYPRTSGPWTGYIVTSQGKLVADSSHLTVDECRRYIQSHGGGMCGLECGAGTQCKKSVSVSDRASN
jgi:hypothetical protein